MERFAVKATDGLSLQVRLWRPTGPIRGIVQLAHGAGEHLGRYEALAARLNDGGIAVVGADHRGHGDNRDLHGLGNFGPRGFSAVVDDLVCLALAARTRFPGAPLALLGHSMGSFAAQATLARHAGLLNGLILSGTTAIDLLLESGAESSLAALNHAFEPARTPFDWLSRDSAEVDRYVADPLCGFDPTPASMASMAQPLTGVRRADRLANAVARQVPVLILSGEADPVGGPGQSLAAMVADDYGAAGLGYVEHRIYPGARHELFFETNRDVIVDDLVAWLERTMLSAD